MFQATYNSAGDDTTTASSTTQSVWSFSRKSPKLPFLAGSAASAGGYSKIFAKPALADRDL